MKQFNILVFPGGMENGLEVWRSLRHCKDIKLFSGSSNVSNHAPFVYKQNLIISDICDHKWVQDLNAVIIENKIDFVYPVNSLVIDALAEHMSEVKAQVIMPAPSICSVVSSKSKTYKFFKDYLPTPFLYEKPYDIKMFPVFVKPDRGYGSQGAQIVYNKEQLDVLVNSKPELIITEFMGGREYTIDVFSAKKKGLLFCCGRERSRIRMGTSMHGILVDGALNSKFTQYAQCIFDKLGIDGAWFFQMKEDSSGQLKLMEIEPKIAGTMALNRVRGVNFPLLNIYYKANIDVEIMINGYRLEIDRALTNRYSHDVRYNKVYVDLDDTLIVHNRINTQLVKFLYQSFNNGCKIILISKSLEADKVAVLKKWKLAGLFDEVIWLKEHESKADFIDPENAIFIDDSFSQRKEVNQRHGISTFDNSMVELLIDERC